MEMTPSFSDIKLDKVISIIVDSMSRIMMEVLEQSIGEHYCLNDWQSITNTTSARMSAELRKCYPLSETLAQSDLYSARGRINMEAVITALKETESRMTNQGDKDQMSHLTTYLEHVYKGLKAAFRR